MRSYLEEEDADDDSGEDGGGYRPQTLHIKDFGEDVEYTPVQEEYDPKINEEKRKRKARKFWAEHKDTTAEAVRQKRSPSRKIAEAGEQSDISLSDDDEQLQKKTQRKPKSKLPKIPKKKQAETVGVQFWRGRES